MFEKPKSILALCALLVLFLGVFSPIVWADQSGASNAISSAKNQLVSCYEAAREAEAAGANITSLAVVLNDAGLLLSQAEFAFSVGDYGAAQDYAVQSQGRLADFVSDANVLKVAGEGERNQDFLINVVGSAGGTVAVLVGSFALWSFLKKKYQAEGVQEIGSAAV